MNDRGLLVNHRGFRTAALASAALVGALAVTACSSSAQPTPIYVVRTPTPTVAAQTPTPTATQGAETTITPLPSFPTPAPPTAPATPTPTSKPTATPSAGPTSPAAFCTGGSGNQPEFVKAANTLKWNFYCASLPKGWSLVSMTWDATTLPGGAKISYKGSSGATIKVFEGKWCLMTPSDCPAQSGVSLGAGSFGGLSGNVYATADGGLGIYVAPGTSHAYQLDGYNMTQATLVGIGTDLKVVPKS
ncbi:MAG: hypothetical protein ABSA21_01595 [Candidatus Limnocylindrales bacterium]